MTSRRAAGSRKYMVTFQSVNDKESQGQTTPLHDDILGKNYSQLLMGKPTGHRSLYRNQESFESTVYKEYPENKPFINDDYERPAFKPVKAYPEGDRRVVVASLRKLQAKIQMLEAERTAAEDNLKSLSIETNKYRDVLEKEQSKTTTPRQTSISRENQELSSKLSAADTRCALLGKQLEYMNTMVKSSEQDRNDALTKTVRLDLPEQDSQSDFQSHLKKITELEREHIRMMVNQTQTDSKIRELEEKLGAEQDHRKQIVEKNTEIETVASINHMLPEVDDDDDDEIYNKRVTKKRTGKKKKRPVVSKKTSQNCSNKPDSAKHYRLRIADIPFVAGKNVGPSHSVGANIQTVFSLMKKHSMALCSGVSSSVDSGSPASSSASTSPTAEQDLAEILLQLQDEFHRMSFEHQELSREINNCEDPRKQEDLERELDSLVSRMEGKSQQISKIRKHQEKMAEKRKKKKSRKHNDYQRPKSALASYDNVQMKSSPRHNGEVKVTTTNRTKGQGSCGSRPFSAREMSLNVLKDMKKLQTTLRKDDLSWD